MLSSVVAQAGVWFNDLKFKINNFDIKPAKPIIGELLDQAMQASDAGNFALAEKILQRILILNRDNIGALTALSEVYLELGSISRAVRMLKRAIRLSPNEPSLYRLLSDIYFFKGRYRASARAMQQILQLCPDEVQLEHAIDGRLGNTTPRAPGQYIIGLFDEYAAIFEDNLVGVLGYKAHTELVNYLNKKVRMSEPIGVALDLGCGTGLLGQALADQFKISTLVGVDLSTNMLEHSRAKNIYQELHNVDLIAYMQQTTTNFDLIASTDVLIYIGDLDPVLAGCYRCLQPGGYLCFSVESMFWGDYKLTASGRYKHSLSYIKSLYKKYHFSKMYSQAIDLRKESGNMVKGYLVLLQK